TLVKEDTLFKMRDLLNPKVHKLDLRYYPEVTDGKPIEDSAMVVSKNVNKVRIDNTKEKLHDIKKIKDNPEELKAHFGINQNLCQDKCDTEQIVRLLPDVISEVEQITKRGKNDLLNSFSTRVKAVEIKLADQLQQTDLGNWDKANKETICKKAASIIMDGIAPKAVLIGHSLGGLVAHLMAVNPKEVAFDEHNNLIDQSKYTFDAANGIALFTSLGAPVENGTDLDSAGMREARYDWCYETILKPIEDPWAKMGLLNFNLPWLMSREIFKNGCLNFSKSVDIEPLKDPEHLKQKPALVQMLRDSSFLKDHVIGKHAPEGVSSLSYYHPDDKYMEVEFVKLNEAHPNNHNIRVNFEVTNEVVNHYRNDLSVSKAMSYFMQSLTGDIRMQEEEKMIRSLYAHDVVAFQPQELIKSFKEDIIQNPESAIRMLDLSNSDTLRSQCLDVIYDQVQANPDFLANNPELLERVQQVSSEGMPFESSPSYRAGEILEISEL
ncbi:MAG: hypothetical protein AB7V50_06265, partial [Vampirovibrionia bacterium]